MARVTAGFSGAVGGVSMRDMSRRGGK
jgi:hypothetical protein